MRVHQVLVVPILLGWIQALRVQLANGYHGVLDFAVDSVAVNVQRLRELVVRAVLLQLAERCGEEIRIKKADVGCGVGVLAQRTGLGSCRGVVRGDFHVGQSVGVARVLNVAVNEWCFLGTKRRNHLPLLNGPRVDATSHNGGDHQHSGTNQGQLPLAQERGNDEQDGHNDGGGGQNGPSGDHSVDVSEHGTGTVATVVLQRGESAQPEIDTQQNQEDPRQNGDVDLGGAGSEDAALGQADGTIEIVGEYPGDEGNHCGTDENPGHEAQERQSVGVKADVQAELRVCRPKRDLMNEQHDFFPLGHGCRTGK